jgi:hypothetical protein
MIKDIKRQIESNLGGVNSYIFIPKNDVVFIPPVINGSIKMGIDIKAGTKWFRGYGVEGTMRYTDDQSESDHGDSFEKKFIATIPKDQESLVEFINSTVNKKFILLCTTNNEEHILLGTIEEPLSFKSNTDSKAAVNERNEVTIEFFGVGTSKSPVFIGISPLFGFE